MNKILENNVSDFLLFKQKEFAGLCSVKKTVVKILKPQPKETVSEWAEKYRYLSPESSAASGRWKNAKTPYLIKVMDSFNIPRCREIIVQSGAQLGKTEIILNIIGFVAHREKSPIICLFPNLTLTETFSKDRVSKMIRDSRVLGPLFDDPKSRDSSNTIGHKGFIGGHLTMTTCSSPANISQRPCRVVICDELDRAPLSSGTEGNVLDLAKKRSDTFFNRKLIACSSPADTAKTSKIHDLFLKSKQHVYQCPCPGCGEAYEWRWDMMNWEDERPESAYLECPDATCQYKIKDSVKNSLVKKGDWTCLNPEIDEFRMGFKMSSLISPWVRFTDLVRKFLDARGNPQKLKVFHNVDLGEVYEEELEGIQHASVFSKKEKYQDFEVPEGACVLTCGVDIGTDNAQGLVTAWGKGEESWAVEYFRQYGDPSSESFWQELDERLYKTYSSFYGSKLKISATCIDSGGHFTDQVYSYVRDKTFRRIFAIKGIGGWGKPIAGSPWRRRRGRENRPTDLYPLCVSEAKALIYHRLKIPEGHGMMHFPMKDDFDREFFKMLVAEEIKIVLKNGYPERQWVLPEHRRCEALDCAVYGYAALRILNANIEMMLKNFVIRKRNLELKNMPINQTPKKAPPLPRPSRYVTEGTSWDSHRQRY